MSCVDDLNLFLCVFDVGFISVVVWWLDLLVVVVS